MTSKEDLLGYAVNTGGVAECVHEILQFIINRTQRFRWLACFNPHCYVVALNDAEYSNALRCADWLVPDGAGIVIASRWLRGRIHERVTGSDVFWRVLTELDRLGGFSVFFLGSTEDTLSRIRTRIASDFPRLRIAGTYSPPFRDRYSGEDNDAMVAAINDARPDVLWVGMTAPKQEKWIHANRSRLNVKFAAAVGAVFDFYSGRIRRSHPIFQKLGLEWLPRLIQEPARLWRRMFVSAPIFLWHVIRQRASVSRMTR
jgi:N-acetylglucosaminyldiphosphoundecaprenol N-acetyl-beta-D-mannosaminyltransferase